MAEPKYIRGYDQDGNYFVILIDPDAHSSYDDSGDYVDGFIGSDNVFYP